MRSLAGDAVFALVCVIPGLALALALDGRRRTPLAAIAADAVALGVGWLTVTAVVLVHLETLNAASIGGSAAGTAAIAAAIAWRRGGGLRGRGRPGLAASVVVVVILAVAVALRTDPSYFIYMTGDMGEYVNVANLVDRGQPLLESFPHGFTSVLAASHALLGIDWTVAVVPFLGVALVALVLGAGSELGVSLPARAAVGAIVAIGVAPVWFSRFPASESLYAPLLAGSLYLLIAAHRRENSGLAMAAGAMTFAFGVTRGNVLLVALPIAAYGLVRTLARPRGLRIDVVYVLSAATAGAGATLYLLRYNGVYMRLVLPDNLGPAWDFVARNGLAHYRLRSVAAAVAVCAALAAGLALAVRAPDGVRRRSAAASRFAPVAVVVGAIAFVAAFVHPRGLADAGGRYGILLLALAAVGVASTLRERGPQRAPLLLIVAIGAAGAVLFARRVPFPIHHAFYLYPDRYLFSETFVATALIALPGADVALRRAGERRSTAIAGGALVAIGLLLLLPQTIESGRHSEFAGSFGQASALAALTRGAPVLWSGLAPADRPTSFFFPNTFRAYALPLELTFGRPVVNVDGAMPPFGPDPTLDPAQAVVAAKSAGLAAAFLVRERPARETGPPPDGSADGWRYRRVGTSAASIWQLPKELHARDERWHRSRLTFDVYALAPS